MYTHIKTASDLEKAIVELEERQRIKKLELKDEFHMLTESLKPANLIRDTFNKATNGSGVANTVIKAGIGMGVGLLSKKLLIGQSTSIVKRLAGHAVKLGVAGIVAKKSEQIKYAGLKLLTNVLGKKKTPNKIIM